MYVTLTFKQLDKKLIEWFKHIGFWSEDIRCRLENEENKKNVLPMDVELELRSYLRDKTNKFCLMVLKHLRSNRRGIVLHNFDLESLEIPPIEGEIDNILAGDSECVCDTLLKMGLAVVSQRVNSGKYVIWPTNWSFDPRISDLVGLRSLY